MADSAHLRIGELSRRVGVSPELLRAWEQRYGLLEPTRSSGGFRLYSRADEERVRSMLRHMRTGVSAAQAAHLALTAPRRASADDDASARASDLAVELAAALDALDDSRAHAVFDRLLATFTLETILRDVVLPYLHELGARWERGEATVAQEHFASHLIRGRLLALARSWGRGGGPRAVLACAPGELHDLALIAFGLLLAEHGWAITYLGPDTPVATIAETVPELEARVVVITSATREHLDAVQRELTELARRVPLALAGAGATEVLARATGASLLDGDPVTEAARLADEAR